MNAYFPSSFPFLAHSHKITSQTTAKSTVSVHISINLWFISEGRHQNYGLAECDVVLPERSAWAYSIFVFRVKVKYDSLQLPQKKTPKDQALLFRSHDVSTSCGGSHFTTQPLTGASAELVYACSSVTGAFAAS